MTWLFGNVGAGAGVAGSLAVPGGGFLPVSTWLFFVVCLFVSSVGFKRTVLFISVGYGFSMAALAVVGLVVYAPFLTLNTLAGALFLMVYGTRLGLFLLRRDRNRSYRKAIEGEERGAEGGLGRKVAVWIGVSILYTAMFMPLLARFEVARFAFLATRNGMEAGLPAAATAGMALTIFGFFTQAAGLLLESLADRQKSRAKAAAPDRFCKSGLYSIVRCPNYFGEMLFWTGSLIAGLAVLSGPGQWIAAGGGYVSIILVMIGSARRLELRQTERYGSDPEYQRYVKSVPVIMPGIPVYSLKNARIYLG